MINHSWQNAWGSNKTTKCSQYLTNNGPYNTSMIRYKRYRRTLRTLLSKVDLNHWYLMSEIYRKLYDVLIIIFPCIETCGIILDLIFI